MPVSMPKTEPGLQVCARCVLDTSDPGISFDAEGQCNHCRNFDAVTRQRWFPNDEGRRLLAKRVESIIEEYGDAEFNCILGLSGGIDSSYLCVQVKELGLRPLVVHVDAGWNSELAVSNIERVVDYCGFELHTHVLNWEEVRDLQLAYLRSGVANQDVVQDHGFFASLYRFAIDSNVRHVISGANIATESVFPDSWHHSAMDSINLHAIHREFGEGELSDFRTISFFDYYIRFPFIKRMEVISPLNFMPYDKRDALEFLQAEVGYKAYGYKHGESVFTKFFQNHFLVEKFRFDKRKPHLSSLILSGQMTREEALEVLAKPAYEDPKELQRDMEYVAKKLRISVEELQGFIDAPNRSYADFANWDRRYGVLKKLQSGVSRLGLTRINRYS